MYRTGYCCINTSIGDNFKTMKLSWADKNPGKVHDKWKEVVQHNFTLLEKIIRWNIQNRIFLYRISSDMIPFADHDTWGHLWELSLVDNSARRMSEGARVALREYLDFGGRITMHPGQFVSISSPNPNTRWNSIKNLEYHAQLLNLLELPKNKRCPINIHISNGSKGEEVVSYVNESLSKVSDSVLDRLVFENEQNGYWNPSNIRKHFPKVPITLDFHHLLINPDSSDFTLKQIIQFTADGWAPHDPVQHWSEGRKHEKDPAHSDYVNAMPDSPYDIEIEAKAKELSVFPHLDKRNKQMDNVLY